MKHNKVKNPIRWIDRIVLDPKKYKKASQYVIYFIFILIIGFVLVQIFLNNYPAYWPLMGILIALAIIVIITVFVFSFLKGFRYTKFNKQNFENELLNCYLQNDEIKNFDLVANEGSNMIPANDLPCSKMPRAFKYATQSQRFQVTFKNPGISNLDYVMVAYRNQFKAGINAFEGNVKKFLVIEMKSINSNTFYISGNTINFDNPNEIAVNHQPLTLKGKTPNYYVFGEANKDFELKALLNISVLDQFLFNPEYLAQSYDLYNNSEHAYLIVTVPMMFMNSKLEFNESIKDFGENLKRQAKNDITALKLAASIKMIIEQDLSKAVIDLDSKKAAEVKMDEPELKLKESTIDSKDTHPSI